MRLPLVSCSLVLVLVGCPGDDTSSSDDAAATTSGSDGSSTAAASTGDSATSVATTTDDDTSTDPSTDDGTNSCPPFVDDVAPSPITIDVVNNLTEGVWVPMDANCLGSVPYSIADPGGVDVNWRGPACGTCEGAAQGDCPCPPPFCDETTALYLEPGGMAHYTWSGLTYVTETLPATCSGINECGETCERAVVPTAGVYSFRVYASATATGCSTEPCDCMPSEGSCTLYDPGMTFGDLTEHSATLMLPDEPWVVISIF